MAADGFFVVFFVVVLVAEADGAVLACFRDADLDRVTRVMLVDP